ncbi:hypothetical protein EXIGLDRAFT_837619 [Exidia glandulosa HHB12029]|uniref:DUF6535 domain-containing protein n=1 Tax=Exidia glandulosa HHB12029 TaxID=1314781 RepID=A0A165GMH4_EXIGL|nr:hypothetical protein EXIGLDRAFT_837619 [Exidia glandulosa HHB12029]
MRHVNAPLKLPTDDPDTDFKRKYPPDAELGQELAENARVWKVYRDEAIQHDDGVLAGWNNTIDILLTFAGLFSAAVTAFVVESYQFLQPAGLDFGAAFYALAVNDTETLHTLAVSSTHAGSTARWINGLWFTSLFFALAAAFLCILVKQWLDEYIARTRASSQNPKHWSRRRAFYFRAIDDWGVAGIISLLPLLLHAALFLFFAGMVVLLWSLSRDVAAWLSVLACLLFLLYVTSILIPVWNAACPFATPLAKHLHRSWCILYIWLLRRGLSIPEIAAALAARWSHLWRFQPNLGAPCPHPRSVNLWKLRKSMRDVVEKPAFDQVLHMEPLSNSDDASGLDAPSTPRLVDELDCDALHWLIHSVSDSDTNAVGIQALGALVPCTPLAVLVSRKGIISQNTYDTQLLLAGPTGGGIAESARIIRSILALSDGGLTANATFIRDHIPPTAEQYRHRIPQDIAYPDMRLLRHGLFVPIDLSIAFEDDDYVTIRDQAAKWDRTPSLHSTSMLLTSLQCLHRHHVLLFLLCSDLALVSHAQWQFLMSKLRNTNSPCPRHLCDVPCNLECFMELISSFLLQESADDIDIDVVRQLFDATCHYLPPVGISFLSSRLSDLPTFLTYLASAKFVSCTPSHASASATNIMFWISNSTAWNHIPRVDPLWMRSWRHAAYVCRLQSATVYAPTDLIRSVLANPADQHMHHTAYPPFEVPSSLDATLRAILVPEDDADRLVPSIWNLIATEKNAFAYQTLATGEALATSLCTMSRNAEGVDDLVTLFLAPLTARHLVMLMYFFWPRQSDDISLVFPSSALTFCSHIMELRPSWWLEELNVLLHEDENLDFTSPWGDPVAVSEVQSYAATLTEECLRRGPCYDCPLTVAPLAFDISLRTFTVNPFGVYPIVDTEEAG